jgi:hypothetical protein
MNNHDFCRGLLKVAREEAKQRRFALPPRITALKSTPRLYFVEADGGFREYFSADCAYHARAKFITNLMGS